MLFGSKAALAWKDRLSRLLEGNKASEILKDELEALLFEADLSASLVDRFLTSLNQTHPKGQDEAIDLLIQEAVKIAKEVHLPQKPMHMPFAILLLGVNGSGKTTVAARLGKKFIQEGKRIVLAAADTFRAGAIEQLQFWGKKIGAEVVAQKPGADPAAIAFDAWQKAVVHEAVLIVDTAGRLHTKTPLVEQLKKVVRVLGKDGKGAPHEKFLVLDGNVGQNALAQSREFLKAVSITGLIVTKLDGSARGGAVLSSSVELSIPIRYVGVGERAEDLNLFDPKEFATQLFQK